MKTVAVLAIVAAIAVVYFGSFKTESSNDLLFSNFINEYGRNYANEAEYNMRKEIFMHHLKTIQEHNAKGLSWTLGVNEYTDWTDEEYSKLLGLKNFRNQNSALPVAKIPQASNDKDIDWRDVPGYVGAVKNQLKCGSCWSFSATGAMEASYFKKYGKTVILSEKHVVDCDHFSHGCNGGLQENAFVHWMRFGPITEDSYPYQPVDGPCREKQIGAELPELPMAFRVDEGDNFLYDALTHQPVAISIRAENDPFRHYTGGIIDGPDCGTDIDHAVLLVGYNQKDQYWIVKNSWGSGWGENGYVRIKRRGGHGICGINQQNSIPVYEDDF